MTAAARNMNTLLWMARCDFKLRDQGTFLGFIWTLLNPLIMFVVLYLVFSAWFEKLVDHYPIYLIWGIIHWNFFALATSNAVNIFERKRHLLKCFALSGGIIPTSAVLTVFVSYLFESLIVLFICSFVVGITFSGLAWFIALLFVHLILVLGTSLLLANAFIFIRDVSHLWGIALRIGFFITPVFYPLSVIDDKKLLILKLNPLFHLFNFFRDAVLKGTVRIDGYFAYLILVSFGLFFAAIALYRRNQVKLVERL